MKTLITFATRWGPQFGGINSLNQDLLQAVAAAFSSQVNVICVVLAADQEQINNAETKQVQLISLDIPEQKEFLPALLPQVLTKLKSIPDNKADHLVWLGHDRITGDIAVSAAQEHGGRSALIHHMNYGCYEAFCEDSATAKAKTDGQKALFEKADIVLAVGPLLRNELIDMLDPDDENDIHLLIPGLPDIQVRKRAPQKFQAFISGRLSDDAKKLKQGHLGVAAFAFAVKQADDNPMLPAKLRGENKPQLTLRGMDFENITSSEHSSAEHELNCFAEDYANRVITLHALPFTKDRESLFDDLKRSSVALMPSWHEGFGLVAWEAIAAGVPLIVSKNSGVYKQLEIIEGGLYASRVYPINIAGSHQPPYFSKQDLSLLSKALITIAQDYEAYRSKALQLREKLLEIYTWANCARDLSKAFGWHDTQNKSPALLVTPDSRPQPIPSVVISQSSLDIPTSKWQSGMGYSPSALLKAEEAVIPFDQGREAFLAEQLNWAKTEQYPIAIRLLTGQGGVGKTRLALELCKTLKTDGWHSGFWRSTTALEDLVKEITACQHKTCIVIDYAETRQQPLLQLIKALLNSTHQLKEVRILLLARDSGEWWDLLPSKDKDCQPLLDGMATSGPYLLPPLHESTEHRHQAYQHAMRAYAEKLDLQPVKIQPVLDDEHYSHPLYIQMAALLALFGEQPSSAESVARALVAHERQYWAKIVLNLNGKASEADAALLMTLATLAGGFSTFKDAEKIWGKLDGDKKTLKNLFPELAKLYPSKQGLHGLRPDLLGEALVVQSLSSDQGSLVIGTLLADKTNKFRQSCLTVLSRILLDRAELSAQLLPILTTNFISCADDLIPIVLETPSPLIQLVEKAFSQLNPSKQSQACGILNKYFTEDYLVPLIDFEVLLRKSIYEKVAYKSDSPDTASALINLSVAIANQGDNAQALSYSEQAVTIYKKLAQAKPERFAPEWAMSLNNYAILLSENGQIDTALTYTKQALDIREKLAQAEPEHFTPDWVSSLNNYAILLSENGQVDAALTYAKQALDIREKLAQAKPERFAPDWAMSLNNYAILLSENGQIDTALTYAKQALDIREKLAQAKPERFTPDWAMSLYNYANRLSENGQMDSALTYAKQALDIREKLATAKPKRYKANFIISELSYALMLWLNDACADKQQELTCCSECSDRDQNLINFYSSFIKAVTTLSVAQQLDELKSCDHYWQQLDNAQRQLVLDRRIIVTALAEKHQLNLSFMEGWREQLAKLSRQRAGHLPWDMLEIARRHDLEINDKKTDSLSR